MPKAHSPLNPHIEERSQDHSIHDKSASEELCDEDKGEEDHSAHDESVSGKENDAGEKEQSVPSQNTPEEFHDEEVEEEAAQVTAEQARVSTLEQLDQHNTEEAPRGENKEIGQDETTALEVQSPSPSKQTVVPSRKTKEIRRLQKER